jgi:trimethylamine-N-oxide reductase (cytochrome c)
LAEFFPDDKERGPYPKWIIGGSEADGWQHDETLFGERAKNYPLLIVTTPMRWRHHVQGDDITWFKEIPTCKVKGYDGYLYEPCWINPVDATARSIANGDIVKIFNERGIVLAGAYITERAMPGSINIGHGAKHDPITTGIDRGGQTNLICPDNPVSKNCVGFVTTGYLVEVNKLDPAEMEVWKKQYPEAFSRAYDPAYGVKRESWIEGGTD